MAKPKPRRDGREAALQFLFSNELNKLDETGEGDTLEAAIAAFWEIRNVGGGTARNFATTLINGVHANREAIDEKIVACLENYRMERVTVIDRNLLRLAVFEIAFSDHIPAPAAINEAIEIAKRFGAEDSARFINGVLDRILKNYKNPPVAGLGAEIENSDSLIPEPEPKLEADHLGDDDDDGDADFDLDLEIDLDLDLEND